MRAIILTFAMSAGTAVSADMLFEWPVDCALGETCYIQNYVDRDPGPEWRDFSCGKLSYDTHRGTDIALPTRADLTDDVAVFAAAPGVVQGRRDGVADRLYNGEDLDGKDCGNGVVIDHGNGWVSQYCHLKRGSVRVGRGARVEAGQAIGEIGLSGRTEFPHLHFAVRKDGQVVDPFSPNPNASCEDPITTTLWAERVPYAAGGLLDVGFSKAVPNYDAVKAGTADTELNSTDPIVLFAFAFGAVPGDLVRMSITGPNGAVFDHTVEIDRARAQFFRAGGKRSPSGGWPHGTYLGLVELSRGGEVFSEMTTRVSLTD
ncbi:M23 family metallopeptidase [Roseobacteraceae bacterium S113]